MVSWRGRHKYDVEHTGDPESRYLPGGIPREHAGDGGFQLLQVQGDTIFIYQYGDTFVNHGRRALREETRHAG